MRTAALACLVVCGCHGSSTPFSVLVDPPTAGDAAAGSTSCIGVVGFEVTINSTEKHASGPLLGVGPVLDAAGCRIATPYTVEGLPLDQPINVTVVGYDSAHLPRVMGTNSAPSAGGEPLHVQLAAMGGAKPVILVLERTPLLGTTPLSDVTSMVISTVGGGAPLEIVNVMVGKNEAGLFFTGVEPGAFGIDAAPPLDLAASFTVSQGNAPPKTRLTASLSQSGLYWQAR